MGGESLDNRLRAQGDVRSRPPPREGGRHARPSRPIRGHSGPSAARGSPGDAQVGRFPDSPDSPGFPDWPALAAPESINAYLDWRDFEAATAGLLLWEAFVTGGAKGGDHMGDALIAAKAFCDAQADFDGANAVQCSTPVYSLIGAALLRTGWSIKLDMLKTPCLVIRASASVPKK